MQPTQPNLTLPPVRLIETRDPELVDWFNWANENNVNKSAYIREALLQRWQRQQGPAPEEILDRIERKLNKVLEGGIQVSRPSSNPILDDPVLGSDL